MKKPKRKLTKAERKAKALRRAMFMTIFINGKQKRVRRPELIDGLTPEEFIMENADPIWLHQNEMWEYMTPEPAADRRHGEARGSGYDRCMADEKQPEPSSPAKDGKPVGVKESAADPVSRVYGMAGNGNTGAIMARLRRGK